MDRKNYMIIGVIILMVALVIFGLNSYSTIGGEDQMEYPSLKCNIDNDCVDHFIDKGVPQEYLDKSESICLDEGFCMMRAK